jgi:DegV family protein with EDD domain
VRLVVDSTADFQLQEAEQLGISVVPLTVRFGDESYLDRVELSTAAFYDRLRQSKVLPTTSQPSPAAFGAAFQPLLDEGADIVCMCLSSALSGTYNTARLVANQLAPDRIVVIDTKTVTFAMQVLVRQVLEATNAGLPAAEAPALFDELFARSSFIGALATLEYLRRGGRIGRAASLVGTVLDLKPLVTMRDGVVAPLENVRTRQRALARTEERVLAAAPFTGPLLVGHSGDAEAGEAFAARLRERLPRSTVLVQEMGPVVWTHAGPGTVGVAYIRAAHAE